MRDVTSSHRSRRERGRTGGLRVQLVATRKRSNHWWITSGRFARKLVKNSLFSNRTSEIRLVWHARLLCHIALQLIPIERSNLVRWKIAARRACAKSELSYETSRAPHQRKNKDEGICKMKRLICFSSSSSRERRERSEWENFSPLSLLLLPLPANAER